MIYVVLAVAIILVIGTAIITWNLTSNVLKSKHRKEMTELSTKNKIKTQKKEEVIKNANKKKSQINTGNANTDFDNSLDILHQLSQRE